jgi:DNA repair protein RadC
VRDFDSTDQLEKVIGNEDAYHIFSDMQNDAVEKFVGLFLSGQHHVLACTWLFSGGVSEAVVDPKILVKAALDIGATSVIIAHNHPSGEIKPSSSDIALTKRLKSAFDIFDICLLDHMIIGLGTYYSFAADGRL